MKNFKDLFQTTPRKEFTDQVMSAVSADLNANAVTSRKSFLFRFSVSFIAAAVAILFGKEWLTTKTESDELQMDLADMMNEDALFAEDPELLDDLEDLELIESLDELENG